MADTIINFIICTPAFRAQIFDRLCSKRISSSSALYAQNQNDKRGILVAVPTLYAVNYGIWMQVHRAIRDTHQRV